MPAQKKHIRPFFLVAVTGGFGAGKSTVANFIAEWYPVFDSDRIAAEILSGDTSVHAAVRAIFGDEVFAADGSPDRAALAARVFPDASRLAQLNRILHPPTIREIEQRALKTGSRIVFVESALVYEAKLERMFDAVIAVVASEADVLRRAAAAAVYSEADVRSRVDRQIDPGIKASRADITIRNDDSPDKLRPATRLALSILESLARNHDLART